MKDARCTRVPAKLIKPGHYFGYDGSRFLKSQQRASSHLLSLESHPVAVEVGTGRVGLCSDDLLVVPVDEVKDLGQEVALGEIPQGSLFRLDGRLHRKIGPWRQPGTSWVASFTSSGFMMDETVVRTVPPILIS